MVVLFASCFRFKLDVFRYEQGSKLKQINESLCISSHRHCVAFPNKQLRGTRGGLPPFEQINVLHVDSARCEARTTAAPKPLERRFMSLEWSIVTPSRGQEGVVDETKIKSRMGVKQALQTRRCQE